MYVLIENIASYAVIGGYLVFLVFVYFLTEVSAQKYLAQKKDCVSQERKAQDFNIYLVNVTSVSEKSANEVKKYKLGPFSSRLKVPFSH